MAMWLAAFSSSSVLKNTSPVSAMRPSLSTSATSPSLAVGVDLDCAPAIEADLESVDHGAGHVQWLGGRHDALGAGRVRGCERLLARQVRVMLQIPRGLHARSHPG